MPVPILSKRPKFVVCVVNLRVEPRRRVIAERNTAVCVRCRVINHPAGLGHHVDQIVNHDGVRGLLHTWECGRLQSGPVVRVRVGDVESSHPRVSVITDERQVRSVAVRGDVHRRSLPNLAVVVGVYLVLSAIAETTVALVERSVSVRVNPVNAAHLRAASMVGKNT